MTSTCRVGSVTIYDGSILRRCRKPQCEAHGLAAVGQYHCKRFEGSCCMKKTGIAWSVVMGLSADEAGLSSAIRLGRHNRLPRPTSSWHPLKKPVADRWYGGRKLSSSAIPAKVIMARPPASRRPSFRNQIKRLKRTGQSQCFLIFCDVHMPLLEGILHSGMRPVSTNLHRHRSAPPRRCAFSKYLSRETPRLVLIETPTHPSCFENISV